MDEELYKFRERNFDFENKFPQFGSIVKVLNDSRLNGKLYLTQMAKKMSLSQISFKSYPY